MNGFEDIRNLDFGPWDFPIRRDVLQRSATDLRGLFTFLPTWACKNIDQPACVLLAESLQKPIPIIE